MYHIASAGTIVFNRREKKSKQSQKIRDNGQVSLLAPKTKAQELLIFTQHMERRISRDDKRWLQS